MEKKFVKCFTISLIVILQTLIPYNYILVSLNQDLDLEYKVKVGDFGLFQYTKFYDARLIDPFKDYRVYTDINGTLVNVSISKGTFLKCTIIDLMDNYRYNVQITINNSVTYSENRFDNFIVRPTSDKASLEVYYADSNRVAIENNYLIERSNDSSFLGNDGIYYFLNRYTIFKWDIKTGWLFSSYILIYDDQGIIYYENEFVSRSYDYIVNKTDTFLRIGMFIVIILIIMSIGLFHRKVV